MSEKPWLKDEPFGKDFVEFYNRFSHFWVNPNEEFRKTVKAIEKELAKEFGSKVPSTVKSALQSYRKALYEYYIAKARARAIAPPISVVGRSKYKGRPERAEKIERRAYGRLEKAKDLLISAVAREKHKKTISRAEKEVTLTIDELKGQRLKKDLGLDAAIKVWHNKHKDGSGNFGFMLRRGARWVRLAGSYTPSGKIYELSVETAEHAPKPISAKSYTDLLRQLAKLFGVSVAKQVSAAKSSQKGGKKSKLSEIMTKVRRGEKLTKSEREYLSKVMKQVKRRQREELSKKYAKLSLEELRAMFANRSKRSRALDVKKRAKRVITKPEDYYLWVRAPSRYDVEGVDTPKRKRR